MIHVLTLTWNGLDKLKKLKDGLIRNIKTLNQPTKWYIRSNGCSDGTKKWLENWDDGRLEVIPLFKDHNRDNFAQGVNSLYWQAMCNCEPDNKGIIAYGKDDFILLLNNDIIFGDDISLTKMYNLIKNNRQIGVVGARLLYNNSNSLQHSGVAFSKRYNSLPYHFRHKEESDKSAEKNRYFQAVTAACCLIRGVDFIELDELFFWCYEDIDFMLRIGEAGKKIAYCGETKIYHEESVSLRRNPINKIFLQQNIKRFREKWSGKYDLDYEKYITNPNYKLVK